MPTVEIGERRRSGRRSRQETPSGRAKFSEATSSGRGLYAGRATSVEKRGVNAVELVGIDVHDRQVEVAP